MQKIHRLVALIGGHFALAAALAQTPQPVIELAAGIHRIEAEVAAEPAARMQGLMHRRHLPPQAGMLFVFPQKARHCMWMKNTYLPLSVAFLEEDGRIVNIEEMQPLTEENHCTATPVRFALEMNQGWFRARGLKAGDRISGLDKAPPGR